MDGLAVAAQASAPDPRHDNGPPDEQKTKHPAGTQRLRTVIAFAEVYLALLHPPMGMLLFVLARVPGD
ncbi:hypothetical protein [Verminephrobacter aporrectodeae]|uniref:hypothetical protein n=1 Tax=Verminephrobacter aporrectodeae TaxID=1110389 RepID=UPI002ADDBF72|nr:hypothetical protein [Verminephrobacter aporrectodeae]